MSDLQRHAVVLGAALILAAGILAARGSSSGSKGAPVLRPAAPPAPAPATAAATPSPPAADRKSLEQVRALMADTREILKLAANQDDNQARLVQAKKNLEECQALLEGLPESDPDVVKERQRLQQLRLDVVKVSGL